MATVDFSTVVSRAADECYLALKELVNKSRSTDLSDSDKKNAILRYVVDTQQRMLRLNVLAKWCQQVPLTQHCEKLESALSSHDSCFIQAADSLFSLHADLKQASAPMYDVPSAVQALITGKYNRLPKCIEDLGMTSGNDDRQQKSALRKLDSMVRSKLLESSTPREISQVKVTDGTALIRVNGEFKVLVTLGYRGHFSLWRILHLELLVGERNAGNVKLEEMRQHYLVDDLERRMAASEDPFLTLYSVLHQFCAPLIIEIMIGQVQGMIRQARWKDAIRFESFDHISDDGLKTPGLKISYWLGSNKPGPDPFIVIEPGVDGQMKCLHSSFMIDPLTGNVAEFLVDQSCIDVEKLLAQAICCNEYTRLLEIFKDMEKMMSPGDVHLESTKDALLVRAHGSSFFRLGININGRFIVRSSNNIVSRSELCECEDALNQRSMTAAKAFTGLRRKSILHLFALTGKFLGMEIDENGGPAKVKLPKNISDGLLMGFPNCGGSYYLLVQLDDDLKPLFKILETQPDLSGNSNNVIRMNVDVSQIMLLEDDISLSLLDCEKLPSVSSSISSFPSDFASIVDQAFELEKGSPVNDATQNQKDSQKRSLENEGACYKRRRMQVSEVDLVAEANKGNFPSSIYAASLLHVVRHCSMAIKYSRLTNQMDELDIPYVEELGFQTASSNLLFSLPSWKRVCLRLGRPGSMHWDVVICGPYFTEFCELEKGSSENTPWGSGVLFAATSDSDAHISCDAQGVVLSYHSVEADSIKKMVADIERLSNARSFALEMQKLLRVEENTQTDELKEAFKIEAVGIMSLWFSFGSSGRYVVEWEGGKEGCTVRVSPNHRLPRARFMEEMINGAQVASLLDCMRLTAGPLQAERSSCATVILSKS